MALNRCAMKNCHVEGSYNNVVKFYKIPPQPDRAKQWLRYCRKGTRLKTGRVCSKHFLAGDFTDTAELNPLAVPTPCYDRQLSLNCSVPLKRLDLLQMGVKKELDIEDVWTGYNVTKDDDENNAESSNMPRQHLVLNALYGGMCCCVCLRQDTAGSGMQAALELGKGLSLSLHEILEAVLHEKVSDLPGTNFLCEKCTDASIRAYIFIQNAKDTADTLTRHLGELRGQVDDALDRLHRGGDDKKIVLYTDRREAKVEPNKDAKATDYLSSDVQEMDYQSDDSFKRENTEEWVPVGRPTGRPRGRPRLTGRRAGRSRRAVPPPVRRPSDSCVMCGTAPCVHARHLRWWRERRGAAGAAGVPCPDCDYKTRRKLSFMEHVSLKHIRAPLWRCHKCNKTCFSKKSLTTHFQRCLMNLFICAYCDEEFNRKQTFVSHITWCQYEKRPFGCQLCAATFADESDVLKHNDKRHVPVDQQMNPRSEFCKVCFKKFTNIDDFFKHKRQCKAKPDDDYSQSPNLCPVCGKQVHSLKRHLVTHNHTKRSYLCDTCAKTFRSARDLKRHKKSAHLSVKVNCDVCGKLIKTCSMYEHKRRHESNWNEIREDLRIRRLAKRQKCTQCDYYTAYKVSMEQHIIRYHTKNHAYPCEICSKRFTSKYLLKLHLRTHDPERVMFQCSDCSKQYRNRNGLIHHIRNVHSGERPHVCEQCGASYVSRSSLTYHRGVAHAAPERCPVEGCGRLQGSWTAVKKHLRRVHWKVSGPFDPWQVKGLSPRDAERYADQRRSDYTGPTHRLLTPGQDTLPGLRARPGPAPKPKEPDE